MMTWLLKLRPADSLTIVFSSFLLVLTLVYFPSIPSAGYLMLIYSSIILFQIVLIYIGRINPFLAAARDIIFPVVSVLVIFDSLGLIVHAVNRHDIDYLLIRFDYRMFGGYSTVLLERFINPLLTDVLQVAYSTYYFIPIALGISLKVGGKRGPFEKSLFLMLFCFYLSYVGYLLFPAVGPRYAMNHLYDRELDGFLVSRPIQNTLNLLEGIKRDAFPSGHTAIALTSLFLSYRYDRTLFRWMLVPVILLVPATVYCRYHYAVDVVAGAILAVVTLTAGEVYYNLLSGYARRS
ncbi:MAG: phosphatase PAP2 family protein [Nitrospirae bacterium]|nr:phosphatase PAP2 family protein [Nitrospirota bacterium]